MRLLYGLALLLFACNAPQPSTPEKAPISQALAPELPTVDTNLYETFRMMDGDVERLMKKYYMVFLKTGPERGQDPSEAAKLQKAHLAHLGAMVEAKKICMVGPFESEGAIRGIAIYSTPTMAEADSLAHADPAVKAGRLSVEVHPWWAAVGAKLF
ncbi:MAG: YciI family protein [Bacteroidota bacterium]